MDSSLGSKLLVNCIPLMPYKRASYLKSKTFGYVPYTHPLRVGQHELIYKVVIACFMANLPQPRYMVSCDVDKMLDLTFTLLWITLPYQTNV